MTTADLHPLERVLPRSKLRWSLWLIGSLIVVRVSDWMLSLPPPRYHSSGWIGLICFGLTALFSALMLVPGSAYLRLTTDGFAVRCLWRTRFTSWNDVSTFTVRSWWERIFVKRAVVRFDRRPSVGMIAMAGWQRDTLPETYGHDAD